jgi:recombinational DNA repair protein RecT
MHNGHRPDAEGDNMSSNHTPSTEVKPAQRFAMQVERLANDFLAQIVDEEQVKKAVGRLALAIRKAGVTNDAIYQCDPASVAQAVAMSALTGLMPGGVKPEVYLIPRKGRLEWQISVRGLQALATRYGWESIVAKPVHAEDEYRVFQGSEERIEHVPCGKWPTGMTDIRGMYVRGKSRTGSVVCVDVPIGVIEARRKAAQNDSVWRSWPIEMAQKTAIAWAISRGYFGSLESSPEMQHMAEYDQSSHRESAPAKQHARAMAVEYSADVPDTVAAALDVEVEE